MCKVSVQSWPSLKLPVQQGPRASLKNERKTGPILVCYSIIVHDLHTHDLQRHMTVPITAPIIVHN